MTTCSKKEYIPAESFTLTTNNFQTITTTKKPKQYNEWLKGGSAMEKKCRAGKK